MLEGICTVGVIIMVPGIKVGQKPRKTEVSCVGSARVSGAEGLLEGYSQLWWGRHQRQKLRKILER